MNRFETPVITNATIHGFPNLLLERQREILSAAASMGPYPGHFRKTGTNLVLPAVFYTNSGVQSSASCMSGIKGLAFLVALILAYIYWDKLKDYFEILHQQEMDRFKTLVGR